jgi:proteasome accessory factor A
VTRDSDFKKLVRQRMAATGQSYTAARAAIYRLAADAELPMTRRVFGLKTSYAVAFDGGQAPGEGGAGQYLFRQAAGRGTSPVVYLENGALLGLRPDESGAAQPAYATPECDSIVELVAAQRAGDEILTRLATQAEESLAGEGSSSAAVTVSRAVAAQSESYLVTSIVAAERYLRLLEPFLATRWVYGGPWVDDYAGALPAPRAAMAATAFADEDRYRRLKITGAGPGLSELVTFVRVGATEQVLRLAESSTGVPVDHRRGIPSIDAVRTQRAYLAAARRAGYRRPEDDIVLDAWQAALDSHEDSHDPAPGSQADIPIAAASQIETAVNVPPQTTRARLRGLFIKTAKDHRRNFTVDWAHLKLNDSASRTVLYRNPLDAHLEIAERLIASMSGPPA